MNLQNKNAEPAEKVQKEILDFNRDETNSILNSIQQMDRKLEKVYQDVVNISDRLSNSLKKYSSSSLVEDRYINLENISFESVPDKDCDLEVMKIFYNRKRRTSFLPISNRI